MYTWFADNSHVHSRRKSSIPDIVILGGILVHENAEREIRNAVENYKLSKFGHKRWPVKYNFKDLKHAYHDIKKEAVYQDLLKDSKVWKKEIFQLLAQFDFKIIISCIEAFSVDKKKISANNDHLATMAFSNCLMRVGMEAFESCEGEPVILVLDWPEQKDHHSPYTLEHASAYSRGKSKDGVLYNCGCLSELGFIDSVYFSVMKNCVMLQIADLIVGAFREFIEVCQDRKPDSHGSNLLKILLPKIRGYPNQMIGRGLILSSRNPRLADEIKKGFKQLIAIKN